MPRSEVGRDRGEREERGEKRGIPGLGIGIINRLANNLRQMGGRSNPYGTDAILTPASARTLYGL
jgi:hypothetical protein